MESGSPSAKTPEQPTNALANLFGTLIALLTLAVPLTMIAHYSPQAQSSPQTPYLLYRPSD